MPSLLQWEIEESGDTFRITLSGHMTEHVDFTELVQRPETKIAIVMEEVRRFTSAGVREWVRFVTAMADKREVFLERCSVAMVHQLSMIANMAGGATIRSIMVPYQCPVCDNDQEEVLEIPEGILPEIDREVICSDCGEKTEFDDIADSYLAFAAPQIEHRDLDEDEDDY